jgi:hypothetical protein
MYTLEPQPLARGVGWELKVGWELRVGWELKEKESKPKFLFNVGQN